MWILILNNNNTITPNEPQMAILVTSGGQSSNLWTNCSPAQKVDMDWGSTKKICEHWLVKSSCVLTNMANNDGPTIFKIEKLIYIQVCQLQPLQHNQVLCASHHVNMCFRVKHEATNHSLSMSFLSFLGLLLYYALFIFIQAFMQ